MRKYRLTKITVKTREIISLSKQTADDIHISLCPQCQTPFIEPLADAEYKSVETADERRTMPQIPDQVSGDK